MNDYLEGTYVEHVTRQDWGVGVVGGEHEGKVEIVFPAIHARKRFPASELHKYFRRIARESVPPEIAAAVTKPTERSSAKIRSAPEAKCKHCGDALSRSRYSVEGRHKACPRCSTAEGSVHVYWRFPDAFGSSEARETVENVLGAQSYCMACRGVSPASLEGAVLCSTVRSQPKQPLGGK